VNPTSYLHIFSLNSYLSPLPAATTHNFTAFARRCFLFLPGKFGRGPIRRSGVLVVRFRALQPKSARALPNELPTVSLANEARRSLRNGLAKRQRVGESQIERDEPAPFSSTAFDQVRVNDALKMLLPNSRNVVPGGDENFFATPAEIFIKLELQTAGSNGTST
jgi:hypothetical protein